MTPPLADPTGGSPPGFGGRRIAWTAATLLVVVVAGVAGFILTRPEATTQSPPGRCTLDVIGECRLLGVVLTEPLPLEVALTVPAASGGTVLAVYRTDAVCVPVISFSPPNPSEPVEREPSRFAYVDAPRIEERRRDAIGAGLAPPITGLQTSQTYWTQWDEEWRLAGAEGVSIAAVALYTDRPGADLEGVPGVRAVVAIPSRRTDSLSPTYAGELLVVSKDFPGDLLPAAPPIDC